MAYHMAGLFSPAAAAPSGLWPKTTGSKKGLKCSTAQNFTEIEKSKPG